MENLNINQLPQATSLQDTDLIIVQQVKTNKAQLPMLKTYLGQVAIFKQESVSATTTILSYTIGANDVLARVEYAGYLRSDSGLFNADLALHYTDTLGNAQTKDLHSFTVIGQPIDASPLNIFAKNGTVISLVLTITGNPLIDLGASLTIS